MLPIGTAAKEGRDEMILHGDVIEKIKEIETGTVQCVVTSPPYWGLRDYGIDGQLGLEETPEEYVEKMVEVFRQIKRVLKHDGTVWLNLGDSYAGGNRGAGMAKEDFSEKQKSNRGSLVEPSPIPAGLKPKDLVGIPWRVAFALQADGWWLRQDIIWHKPNPMPESVTDRCTKSHEYIFLLTKSAKYYYDNEAVKEKAACPGDLGLLRSSVGNGNPYGEQAKSRINAGVDSRTAGNEFRNKRSVWKITTQPYKEAHFAVFPEKLPEICIKAGTSEYGECSECGKAWGRVVTGKSQSAFNIRVRDDQKGRTKHKSYFDRNINEKEVKKYDEKNYGGGGKTTQRWQPTCSCDADRVPQIVLDPFFGSGTTGYVAQRLGRKWIGIELNEEYIKIAEKRFAQQDLFV